MEIMHSFLVKLSHLIVLLLHFSCVRPQLTSTSSAYTLVPFSNDVNATYIEVTYEAVHSSITCGIRCSSLDSLSFYYVKNVSQCHCNQQYDTGIDLTGTVGDNTYGFMTRGYMIKDEGSSRYFEPTSGNFSTCTEVADAGFTQDGLYRVYTNTGVSELQYCPFPDGGWTVFQRRMDGSVDFYRTWNDYVQGFGNVSGEFWLGLETIHQQTQGECQLLIYLEAEENNTIRHAGYALYYGFDVASSSDNYRLHYDSFTGNVVDSLAYQNNMQFSTKDVDNDNANFDCAQAFKGGWWYNGCHSSNLNGRFITTGNMADMVTPYGIIWSDPWGFTYSLMRTEMMFRCFN